MKIKTIFYVLFTSGVITTIYAYKVIKPVDNSNTTDYEAEQTARKTTFSGPNVGESLRPSQYGFKKYDFRRTDQQKDKKVTENEANYNEQEVIKSVQFRLKALGYNINDVNGVLDAKSQQALTDFQNSRGLERSGKINQSTLDALEISIIPEKRERKQIYSE